MSTFFPPDATTAAIAAYFHTGITVGLLDIGGAKDWAYSIVSREDAPSIGMIEIATANDRPDMLRALDMAWDPGDAGDLQTAARWLLDDVRALLAGRHLSVGTAIAQARLVASIASLAEVELDMDLLDDDLELVRIGTIAASEEEIAKAALDALGTVALSRLGS